MFKIEIDSYQMGGLRGLLNYTIEKVERAASHEEYLTQLKSIQDSVEKAFEEQRLKGHK